MSYRPVQRFSTREKRVEGRGVKRRAARGPQRALPGLFVVAIVALLTGASPVFAGHGASVERTTHAPVEGKVLRQLEAKRDRGRRGPPPLCGGTITIPDWDPRRLIRRPARSPAGQGL